MKTQDGGWPTLALMIVPSSKLKTAIDESLCLRVSIDLSFEEKRIAPTGSSFARASSKMLLCTVLVPVAFLQSGENASL